MSDEAELKTSTARTRAFRKAHGRAYDRAYQRAERRAARVFRAEQPERWAELLKLEMVSSPSEPSPGASPE